jgi:hypothetical protein
MLLQRLDERLARYFRHAGRRRDRRRDERGLGDARQRDEPGAAGEAARLLGRHLEAEAGLARAARADDRDQADVRAGQERPDRLDLAVPAEQRVRLGGQVVAGEVERLERREGRLQPRPGELPDRLGIQEVAQAVGAQIDQRVVGRQPLADDQSGRLREEHLAAEPSREEPGEPVEAGRQVVPGAGNGLADVDGHPDLDRPEVAPRLGGDEALALSRCRDGSGDGRKGALDRVADRLEEDAALGLDGASEQPEVALDRGVHPRGVALPALGRALDIGEEEGDRAAREGRHGMARLLASDLHPMMHRLGRRRHVDGSRRPTRGGVGNRLTV